MTKQRKQQRVRFSAWVLCISLSLLLTCLLCACRGNASQKIEKAADGQEVYYQCFDSALMIYDPSTDTIVGELDTGEGPLYEMPGLSGDIYTHNVEKSDVEKEETDEKKSYGEILQVKNGRIINVAKFSEHEVYPLAYDAKQKTGYYLVCKNKKHRDIVKVESNGNKRTLLKNMGSVMSGVFNEGKLYFTRYLTEKDQYELLMWEEGLSSPVSTGILTSSDELYSKQGTLLLSDEENIYSGDGSIRMKKCDYNYISDEKNVVLQIQADKNGKTTAWITLHDGTKKEYRQIFGYRMQEDCIYVYGTDAREEIRIQ